MRNCSHGFCRCCLESLLRNSSFSSARCPVCNYRAGGAEDEARGPGGEFGGDGAFASMYSRSAQVRPRSDSGLIDSGLSMIVVLPYVLTFSLTLVTTYYTFIFCTIVVLLYRSFLFLSSMACAPWPWRPPLSSSRKSTQLAHGKTRCTWRASVSASTFPATGDSSCWSLMLPRRKPIPI